MGQLVCFALLFPGFLALRLGGPTPVRVYPEPQFRVSPANGPKPMRVWESGAFDSSSGPTTARTPWINNTNSTNISCDGFLRIGNGGKIFSAPIVASVDQERCSLSDLQSYLWSGIAREESESGSCKCLKPIPMTLVQRYRDQVRCFAAPSSANGWPVPGLVDCAEYSDQVTQLVYHPESGQLRSSGNCLTASPYGTSGASYTAWSVSFSTCLGYADPLNRQAWDVANGVGEQITYVSIESEINSTLGQPMGHVGRIVLRDSADIGKRCLDIGYDLPAVPSTIPAIFLEAILCNDVRFNPSDFAVWRFYQSVPRRDAYGMGQWVTCDNAACADCFDGQLKVVFDSSGDQTDAVSVPGRYSFGQSCDVNTLRRMALPSELDSSSNSTCYCQSNAFFVFGVNDSAEKLSFLWGPNADDLPFTTTAHFPLKNVSTVNK